MRAAIPCGVALLLLGGSALAADPQLEAARHCTQIKDSLERLVCFDRAFAPSEAPAAAPAKAPEKAPAVPVPAAVPAPTLGDEQLQKPAKSNTTEPRSLDARVTNLQPLQVDVYRITLDNGQVWDQNEYSSLFHVDVGDTVRIVKGALGSYRMARVSHGRSGWVDVHRIQ